MAEKRYAIGDGQGWLRVRLEPSQKIVSLIEFLQVEFTERVAGRDHFKILEGVNRGMKGSVAQKSAMESHLGRPLPVYGSAAQLEVSISRKELTYDGTTVSITVSPSAPPKEGVHKIQIPDFPHSIGSSYLSQTSRGLNWFFLGVGTSSAGNDRYLHTGLASAGCVTVDPDGWNSLYQYLIKRRSGDGTSVGTITIKPS